MKPHKTLFIGGCQVGGFPMGPEYGFPELIRRSSQRADIPLAMRVLPNSRLTRPAPVLECIREWSPESLVLQIGTFELNREVSDYVRRALGVQKKNQTSNQAADRAFRPERSVFDPKFQLKMGFKACFDIAVGRRLIDLPYFERILDRFLGSLREASSVPVLLLSPTPCLDYVSSYYRRRALEIYARLAERHGCEHHDVLSMGASMRDTRFGPDRFFADPIHLGARGQECLAAIVSRWLSDVGAREMVERPEMAHA